MSPHLPDNVDPWRFADLEKHFSGQLPLDSFPRLRPSLADSAGMVDYVLEFRRGEQRRAYIQGAVKAELQIVCQRCLKPMPHPLDLRFEMVVVAGPEEADQLPAELDALLVEEEVMSPREVIEDEMILALPLVAMHRLEECSVQPEEMSSGVEPVIENKDSDKENPFAALAKLKTDLKQTD